MDKLQEFLVKWTIVPLIIILACVVIDPRAMEVVGSWARKVKRFSYDKFLDRQIWKNMIHDKGERGFPRKAQ